jgi:hypothetical protein
MFEVFRIPVPKTSLRGIPAAERALLLLASHAVNQLTTLRRLLIFSANYESANELENTLSAAQSQTILRFLFGSAAEAWEMLRRSDHQRIIGIDYMKVLPPAGVRSYEELNKLFGKSNLLHTIRNTLAFHHPSAETVDAAFEDVPEDEDWAWYASDTYRNSFYLASDYMITTGIIKATGEPDVAKAFARVMAEVNKASDELIEFCSYLMQAIVSRHLGAGILSPARGSGTKIATAPGLWTFAIPFFTIDDRTRL